MACTIPPKTWETGFARPTGSYSWQDEAKFTSQTGERSHYSIPPHIEPPSSTVGNTLGVGGLRTWPSYYDGTAYAVPEWFRPAREVDVLICGAGPFGLQVGLILARQGISFRIIDKANTPCLSGRADAIHPRGLELLHQWGLVNEAIEEGPLLNSTAIYRNGVQLFHSHEPTSDSRYQGATVITQGQMERIYIRDLLRHKTVVERETIVDSFEVFDGSGSSHPVQVNLKNIGNGREEMVRAKYLIGADGAASSIREQLKIKFDGLATDIYWAILDCRFKTDYPHMYGLSMVISAEHGGSIIIPREEGYTRFYVQVSGEMARRLHEKRQARKNASSVGQTRIDDHGITPEEALEQLNKIMSPWKIEFASPMSWFSVWKVNERVARHFSSPDLRVHLGGDAAHVHSVLGGFGFNSSMYDAANLGWKLGLCIKKQAEPTILLPTYDSERRIFANRVIRCSGAYLRFICNSHLPLAALRGLDENLETHDEVLPKLDNTPESDFQFVYTFYRRHAMFLLGIEWPIIESSICPPDTRAEQRPVSLRNGVRPPNPRVCLETKYTAYLYDKMGGVSRFHIIIFGSDMQGPVRKQLAIFSQKAFRKNSFFHQYGGKDRFNIILVAKVLPHEAATLLGPRDGEEDDLKSLREQATVVFDDRVPDDDAHYWYGVNHARGAVVAVRPDLAVGISIWPENVEELDAYFGSFLVRQTAARPENAKGAVEVVSNEVSGSEGSDKGVAAHRRRSIRSWISDILA
ncbi:hypothetical protein ASPCAL04962 [Aspergillus calidoustus]|uniref:Uncharacterized protein n=1 Tax=Aspergillus calidoustus TaxID=454130 RepID=A0A0U5C6A0_ASPCI|nr:hypothetical protein ASPCAL04962 [Aspergillus calidoustus]